MIIAVDFDGTLCVDCYPAIGSANYKFIRILRKRQETGSVYAICKASFTPPVFLLPESLSLRQNRFF